MFAHFLNNCIRKKDNQDFSTSRNWSFSGLMVLFEKDLIWEVSEILIKIVR